MMEAVKKHTQLVTGEQLSQPAGGHENGQPEPGKHIFSRSDAVDEIVSRAPGFMERWALLFYTAVLMSILSIGWFIRFPDVIEAEGVLTAVNAPKEIIVNNSGRLVRLLVPNNTIVEKGHALGWLESTGDHASVLLLQRQATSAMSLLENGAWPESVRSFKGPYRQLGEVQQDYQVFAKAREQFSDYTGRGYFVRKRELLQQDMVRIERENDIVRRQTELARQDLQMAEATFNMQRKLFEDKVLSEEEFRKAKSILINKEISASNFDHTIFTNQSRLSDKQKEIDALTHEVMQQFNLYQQALGVFKYALDEWVRKYVILSPEDGKVNYLLPLQENQFLQEGRQIGFTVPGNEVPYIEVSFRQGNLGKIDTGMMVRLQFDAYPFQEFGEVSGTVSYISNVPADSGFLGNIRLVNGLNTTRNYMIPYKNGLKVRSRVVTKDMRLLERFYNNIVKSMNFE